MFKRLTTKKALALILGVGAAVGISLGAYAYFSAGGSGTGNVQVGTSTPFTISATITPGSGGLVPGGAVADVAFSVDNGGAAQQYMSTISLASVTAYSDSGHTTPIAGCSGSWFSMPDVTVNREIAPGTTALSQHGSLSFNDSGTNQDACKNAYLVASFTSS